MKAEHEFPTRKKFYEYLEQYYAGLVLAGLAASEDCPTTVNDAAYVAHNMADALVRLLDSDSE